MNQIDLQSYREIGQIVRLQIQRQSLKQPLTTEPGGQHSPERYYEPRHILNSDQLWITDSVVSVAHDEDFVLDVHAAAHPYSRNRGNGNMLSIGFTTHYDKIRERFGDHLVDGIAGENILVEAQQTFSVDDFQQGLSIANSDGDLIAFSEVTVAAPCVEFSRFCLDDRYAEPLPTSAALRFLDNGTRGFYAYIAAGLPAMIRIGDRLLLRH
jgi:hypothetical protein